MMNITLIRHGETPWNAEKRWQGFAPVPLNEAGLAQARQSAEHLRGAGIQQIISSDLPRARQTAQIIAAQLECPFHLDTRWREINVGSWQGLSGEEIRRWDAERYQHFLSHRYQDWRFPDGESRSDHYQRMMAALTDLQQNFPQQHLLIVTHGGSIRLLCQELLQQPDVQHVPNCSLTRLQQQGQGWQLLCYGAAAAGIRWENG